MAKMSNSFFTDFLIRINKNNCKNTFLLFSSEAMMYDFY